MIDIMCTICKKNQRTVVLYPATFVQKDITAHTYSARRLPDRIHYRLLKCLNCGLIFSSPILPPVTIKKLYQKSFCTYEQQTPFTKRTYLELFKLLKIDLPANPKILEVGCGNGFFLEALKQQGFSNLWGVEPGRPMVARAPTWLKRRIKIDIFRPRQFKKESFDALCCFHTLDHMTDPCVFAKEAFTILKPGGLTLVVVHDTEGWSVKLFGERSPIFDIEHIYLFNQQNLRQLFEKHKFEARETRAIANIYPLWYWWQMTGLSKIIKDWGHKFLIKTSLSNIAFKFFGGNMMLIAQKPR